MHGGVHFGVGGDLTDVSTSPNDPIFWLRTSVPRCIIICEATDLVIRSCALVDTLGRVDHGMLDQIWARWQAEDEDRLIDVAGFYDTVFEPLSGWRNTSMSFIFNPRWHYEGKY